jgi:hypothetical protein
MGTEDLMRVNLPLKYLTGKIHNTGTTLQICPVRQNLIEIEGGLVKRYFIQKMEIFCEFMLHKIRPVVTFKISSIVLKHILFKLRPNLVDEFIYERRVQINRQIAQRSNYTVIDGLFKDTVLPQKSKWSETDLVSMILGLYEQEVLTILGGG